MLATGARGPLVAAAGSIAILALQGTPGRRVKALTLTIAAGAAAWWWASTQGYLVDRLTAIGDNSAQIRLDLYGAAWGAFLTNPFGSGWGGSAPTLGLASGFPFDYPHNIVLEAAAEAGFLGVAGLAWVLTRATRTQWARRSQSPVEGAMLTLLAFFFLSSMFSGDLPSHRTLWVVLGACLVPLAGSLLSDPPGSPGSGLLHVKGRSGAAILPQE